MRLLKKWPICTGKQDWILLEIFTLKYVNISSKIQSKCLNIFKFIKKSKCFEFWVSEMFATFADILH